LSKEKIEKQGNLEELLDFHGLSDRCLTIDYTLPGSGFTYIMREVSQKISCFLSKNLLHVSSIEKAIRAVQKESAKYPKESLENWLFRYQISTLSFLLQNQDLIHLMTKISVKDLSETIFFAISDSLFQKTDKIGLEEILEACLVSLLYPLRQTIGSCFATALVILIQSENQKIFLEELVHLITKNQLKRVIESKEFIAPLNLSIEQKSVQEEVVLIINQVLQKNNREKINSSFFSPPSLLKCFEYTVASMTEFNLDSHTSTLFIALGIEPTVKMGLGQKVEMIVREELLLIEKEAKEAHLEAQKALDQVNMTNSQMAQASSYEKMQSLKAHGYSFQSHLNAAIERRDLLVKESEEISQFFAKWVESFVGHIKNYFQEIFDPTLRSQNASYEDSPAGFRLLCKHGRTNSKAWTPIYTEKEFFQSLKEFFVSLEHSLNEEFKTKRIQHLINQITVQSLQFILEPFFEEMALKRLKEKKAPYEYIKPWCYLSGGTLRSILSCFIGKAHLAQEIVFQPKEAIELLVKLTDFLKDSPSRLQERFIKNPEKSLLMQSETHAFRLQPGLEIFSRFWSDQNFSYTKIRDAFLAPLLDFYAETVLSIEEVTKFFQILSRELKVDFSRLSVKRFDISSLLKMLHEDLQIPHPIVVGHLHGFLKKQIKNFPKISSIPFADTNWPYFYFSFVVNPYTREVEIWRESFDGERYFPMIEWGDQFHGQHGWILFLETIDRLHFSSLEMLKFQTKV
jgi:hypothetical protein